MKTVFKYALPLQDEVRVAMPAFAEILSVGVQDEDLYVWALVDPEMPPLKTTFRIAGTGHPIDKADLWRFVGTVMLPKRFLAAHVFSLDPKAEVPE